MILYYLFAGPPNLDYNVLMINYLHLLFSYCDSVWLAVEAHSDNVYVVDSGNNRIQLFNKDGTFLTKWSVQAP